MKLYRKRRAFTGERYAGHEQERFSLGPQETTLGKIDVVLHASRIASIDSVDFQVAWRVRQGSSIGMILTWEFVRSWPKEVRAAGWGGLAAQLCWSNTVPPEVLGLFYYESELELPVPVADQANAELERAKAEDRWHRELLERSFAAQAIVGIGLVSILCKACGDVTCNGNCALHLLNAYSRTFCGRTLESDEVTTGDLVTFAQHPGQRCVACWNRYYDIDRRGLLAAERAPAPAIAAKPMLSPSEAVYGFAAWLTTRYEAVTLSRAHNAGPAADLVAQFCEANGLAPPRDRWSDVLVHPAELPTDVVCGLCLGGPHPVAECPRTEGGGSAVAAAPAPRPRLTIAAQSQYDPDD